jgi:hypothetical protein
MDTTKKQCASCIYRGNDSNLGGLFCNYNDIEGYTRPCPARACTEYRRGAKRKGQSTYDKS